MSSMFRFIPLLLQPQWRAMKRRWFKHVDLKSESGRDVVLIVFVVVVMLVIYQGTLWALSKVNENPTLAFLPPSQFLGLVLALLFGMLMISSTLSAVGTLFLSEDLDLVLAAPIGQLSFFLGKVWQVCVVASWMPALFLTPLLIAFGEAYHASFNFYPLAVLAMLPYFVIPGAAGLTLAIGLVLIIPVYRVREMALILFFGFLVCVYFMIDTLSLEWSGMRTAEEMLRIISILSMPTLSWLPSNWVSSALEEILKPSGAEWSLYLAQLYVTVVALLALAYLMLQAFHRLAYARARNKRQGDKPESRALEFLTRNLGRTLDPQFRAMLGKELRVLSRDVSQAVQVVMLLTLSLIYLYHLRVFSAVESFPDSVRMWWKSFLFLGNVCMGAFITTAICTRLVYPSISLEGRSFWVVQASPVLVRRLLRIKFWCWFVPVAFVSSLFFASGAFAIGADWRMIIISAISSLVMCWGIVGVAIGLGAVFAHFDWDHPSQLAAGFGSFVFMLCSIILIFLNMTPGMLLLFSNSETVSIAPQRVYIAIAATSVLLILVNIQATRLALKHGERVLRDHAY